MGVGVGWGGEGGGGGKMGGGVGSGGGGPLHGHQGMTSPVGATIDSFARIKKYI